MEMSELFVIFLITKGTLFLFSFIHLTFLDFFSTLKYALWEWVLWKEM